MSILQRWILFNGLKWSSGVQKLWIINPLLCKMLKQ